MVNVSGSAVGGLTCMALVLKWTVWSGGPEVELVSLGALYA